MLRPESIAIIAGTLIAWAGSHCFGIGEIVDVILLGVGFAVLGLSVVDGASEFLATIDLSPRTGPLRQLRAEISSYAYARSPMLRYLEETLAEGYGQLRVNGFGNAIRALRSPQWLCHGR